MLLFENCVSIRDLNFEIFSGFGISSKSDIKIKSSGLASFIPREIAFL